MNPKTVLNAVVAAVLFICANTVHAEPEPILSEVGFIGSGYEIVSSGIFQIENTGRYDVELIDLYQSDPAKNYLKQFAELRALLIKDNHEYVETFSLNPPSVPIALEEGIYKVYIAGKLSEEDTVSRYDFRITPEELGSETDIEPVYIKTGFIPELAKDTKVTNGFINPLGIAEDGIYKVYLTNFAFPKKLTTLELIVANNTDINKTVRLNASQTTQDSMKFEANEGDSISLATIAIADEAEGKGLFGLKVVKVYTVDNIEYETTVLETVVPVGEEQGEPIPEIHSVHQGSFKLDADSSLTLYFSDLKDELNSKLDNPDVIEIQSDENSLPISNSLHLMIQSKETGEVKFSHIASTKPFQLNLQKGEYIVRILSNNSGALAEIYGIRIADNLTDQPVYDFTGTMGKYFIHSASLTNMPPTALLTLSDLCYRKPLQELYAVITNGIQVIDLQALNHDEAPCSIIRSKLLGESSPLSSELHYQVHIYAKPPKPGSDGLKYPGLYNMQITHPTTGAIIHENTGSLTGDHFSQGYEIDISESIEEAEVRLFDYAFPAKFDEITLAVTQGPIAKPVIYTTDEQGAGRYTFKNLDAGTYFVTMVANPGSSHDLATYGIQMTYEPTTSEQDGGNGGGTHPDISGQDGDDDKGGGGGGNTSMLLGLLLFTSLRFRRK